MKSISYSLDGAEIKVALKSELKGLIMCIVFITAQIIFK